MRRATFLASVKSDLVDIVTAVSEPSGSVSLARRLVGRPRDHRHHLAGLRGRWARRVLN